MAPVLSSRCRSSTIPNPDAPKMAVRRPPWLSTTSTASRSDDSSESTCEAHGRSRRPVCQRLQSPHRRVVNRHHGRLDVDTEYNVDEGGDEATGPDE